MIELSIIVPVYNVEKYLEKCVESILTQEYSNFELILIDDGSPDKCGEICDKFKRIDKRIKVIHKENGGLSSARNAGLDIAQGNYVGFVDSDDYICCDMYRKLIKKAKVDNSDIVICDMKYDLNGIDINDTKFEDFGILNGQETLIKYFTNLYFKSHAQNKLYKRILFDDIRFPENKVFEDVGTFYKLVYKSRKVSFINEKLYIYNQSNGNSITKKEFNIRNLDLIDNVREMLEFFIFNKCSDQVISSCMEYYFISVNILLSMLYSKRSNSEKTYFKKMRNLLYYKIDETIYNKGLKLIYKGKKCSVIKYELHKLPNIFYYFDLKTNLMTIV